MRVAIVWLFVAAVAAVVGCSSGTSSGTSGTSGSNPGTCEGVCQNFAAQCAPSFLDPKCVESCKNRNHTPSVLTCCANARLPAGKCEAEGAGEVGSEDCNDDGINCK